jgi:hypothetical protein
MQPSEQIDFTSCQLPSLTKLMVYEKNKIKIK